MKKVKKAKKGTPSENQLVKWYADKVVTDRLSIGFGSGSKEKKAGSINKNLWMDTDFFFSVVFQSADQKYEFLEALKKKFGLKVDTTDGGQIQIINGLKFAQAMGISIKKESAKPFPYANLDLVPLVLDVEKFKQGEDHGKAKSPRGKETLEG